MKAKKQAAERILLGVAAGLLILTALVAQTAGQGAPPVTAGKITTQIPVNHVLREARELVPTKDMDVLWGDTIRTQRGGRVRVRLTDGSVLSVGSQSELKIQKHDAQAQSTELELIYGRVRATATRIVAPGGEFKVRTRAAVAGVVGTEEYVEAEGAVTTVIALGGGMVTVTSTDSRFPDPIVLSPGETTSVAEGRAPAPKRPATAEELGRAFQATEADPIAQLTPNTVLPGATLQSRVTGSKLDTATSYAFDNSGIQVQTGAPEGSDAVPVTITVARDVPAGRYTLTIQRPDGEAKATLIVTSPELQRDTAALEPIRMPSGRNLSGIRGSVFALDASEAQAGSGSRIVSYQWEVLNTQVRSSDVTFNLNTSTLAPGSYTVQLVVVDDRGQTATQQYTVEVIAGVQPAEILQLLASAYESLQPNQFMQYFDELRFRNYAGFSAAIEDSFRNQLESMRVFQRAVNCSVLEEQNQAVCQADFELQFTQKNQQPELLDAAGNPCGGVGQPVCPAGATLGKRTQTGTERTTVRYERGPEGGGWKIVDYSASVSCPGGSTATGINVGSCILAAGSAATPSFLLGNVQVLATNLPLGGTVSGSLEIVPVGGFTGNVNLSGQGSVSGQNVMVQFSPVMASPGTIVSFTITAPSTAPMGFTGPTPFTLVLIGTDPASGQTVTANVAMTLDPAFSLSVAPGTTASSPAAVTHNSNLALMVTVTGGAGFGGSVLVDFPNLPAGFSATPGAVAAGATVAFPLQVTSASVPGPAQVTVRGTSGGSLVRTDTVFLNVTSDFTLTAVSSTNFLVQRNTSMPVDVTVVPISGFAGTVLVDFPALPAGWVATPPNANVAAGATAAFSIFVPSTATVGATPLQIRGTFGTAVRTLASAAQVQSIPPAVGSRTILSAPTESGTQTQPSAQTTTTLKTPAPTGPAPQTSPTSPTTTTGPATAPAPVKQGPALRPADQPQATQPPAAQAPSAQPPAQTDQETTTKIRRPAQLNPAQPAASDPLQPTPTTPGTRDTSLRPAPAGGKPVAGVPKAGADPAGTDAAKNTPLDAPAPGGVTPAAPSGSLTGAPSASAKQPVERGSVEVEVGGCMGFRLSSGSQMECGRGADVEFHSSSGTSIRMEAEGIRSMGMTPLSQEPPSDSGSSGTSAPVQAGSTYLIQMSRGQGLLRIAAVRGASPMGRPRAPRPATEDAQGKSSDAPRVTVILEWRMLSSRQ